MKNCWSKELIQAVRRSDTVESEKDAKLKSGSARGLVRWEGKGRLESISARGG